MPIFNNWYAICVKMFSFVYFFPVAFYTTKEHTVMPHSEEGIEGEKTSVTRKYHSFRIAV